MSGTWPGPDGGLGIRSSITFNKSWTTSWKGHVWQSSKTLEEGSWVWKMAFLQPSRNSSKGQGDTRIEALFHVNQSLWRKHIHRLIWFSGLHFALPAAAVTLKQDYMGDLFRDLVSRLLLTKSAAFWSNIPTVMHLNKLEIWNIATLHGLTRLSNRFIFSTGKLICKYNF